MRTFGFSFVVLLAAIAPTGPALAQRGAPLPPLERRSIVGIVTDTAGRVLDSAEVRLESPRRNAFTQNDGTFAFENTHPARYTVTARKAGHLPQSKRIAVGDTGAAVRFELVPFVFGLPAAITVVTRTGIGGVVADTLHRPIAGATVQIAGSSRRLTTDSAGRFYADVSPGPYMLRISHEGYRTQTSSVTLPNGEGRDVAVWLHESRIADLVRYNVNAFDLNERLVRRNPVWSKIYTREAMAKTGLNELNRLATIGAVARVDENCDAIIDGGPFSVPMWALDVSELEFVEIYIAKPGRRTVTSITSGSNAAARAASRSNAATFACPATVYAWLRR
ncbi:MAG: carboxypeptidase regulatory-like domain-containing protein [Gemmatimonadetes bacterium]|nr:carboxypeptidase regulatory-like domain-containing protein [Gemmatimonadota bacterium]